MPAERKRMVKRWTALEAERQPLIPVWRKITEYLQPYSGRYWDQQKNRAASFASINDNTGSWAHDNLVSGMTAGASPPGRPWFGLRPVHPALAKRNAVMRWLDEVVQLLQSVFAACNVYEGFTHCYSEMGAYGTAAMVVMPHPKKVLHCFPLTIGQYCLQRDWEGNVNTLYRTLISTVGALVREFGLEQCSAAVKQAYQLEHYDQEVRVLHVIEPRDESERLEGSDHHLDMPWRSVYLEIDASEQDGVLRESGFRFFPVVAPRWTVVGDDTWGISPAMKALGDIRGLQHKQVRMAEAIDRLTDPPTYGPVDVDDVERLPGGHTKTASPGHKIENLFAQGLDLRDMQVNIHEGDHVRIQRAFFLDVFRMFTSDDRSGVTAHEIRARQQEQMLMLGPVWARVSREMLKPMIEIGFAYVQEAGMLPPVPEELADLDQIDLEPEFVSVLAQAQRAIGASGTLRWIEAVAQVGATWPQARDRVDADATIDELATMFGAPAKIVRPVEDVEAERVARAKMEAAQVQTAMAAEQAKTARDLAGAPTDAPNALTDMRAVAAPVGATA